jgi:hypothetical protein
MKTPKETPGLAKPLTNEAIRLECLKLAHIHGSAAQIAHATTKADEYFNYVKNGLPKKRLPLT